MNEKNDFKTIGILGGMGPMATVECFKSIVEITPADKDQNHPPIFINNKPQIPDRTESILHGGENPVPLMRSSAKKIEEAGADFLIITCNTAHYYIDEIQEAIEIPILNMIKATMERIDPGQKVGLMATSGTIETGIYQNYAGDEIDIITPDEIHQELFMEVIYGDEGVKAGHRDDRLTEELMKVAENLIQKGAEKIIAGCTEIRLVLKDSDLENGSLLTPLDVISEKAVKKSLVEREI